MATGERVPRTLWLFVGLTLLHLAPIWSISYLPTGDGPTHVYNAWVLHGLVTGDAPPHIANAYRVDWKPHPNWSGHALMALAMTIVTALIAEKLLVTLIVTLTLAGAWFLATSVDPRNDVYAFLAFPFVWTQTLVAGYYNFSLSIGLYLFILAIWWRRRDRPTPGTIALLAALLILCYFSHPMAAGLACGSIVLLSLLTRRYALILAIVPVLPLLAFFGSTDGANVREPLQLRIAWDAARILAKIETLYAFDGRHKPIAIAVAILYAALIVFTLLRERKRRDADAIAILALSLIAMMFWIPAANGTRDLFTGRMSAFVFLILPAWFTPRIEGLRRTALATLLSIIAVAGGCIAFERIRSFGREMERMVRSYDAISPDTTLLPLFFERPHAPAFVNAYAHFISYVALEKRLVDLSNYEPTTRYFPIADRGAAIGSYVIDAQPGNIDLALPTAHADFVATFFMPHDAPNRSMLQKLYRVVKEDGALGIYRRRAPLSDPQELLLLPLLGTRESVGARWRIEQTLHNRDSRPLRVVFRQCVDDLWCDRELAPDETLPIATSSRRFAFLDIPRGAHLDVTTIVRRADIQSPDTSITIPTAHERDFSRGGTSIENIDTRDRKIGLRFYVIGDAEVTLRLRSASSVVSKRSFPLAHLGMHEDPDLRRELAGAPLPDLLHIDIDVAENVRVWAFVTANGSDGRTSCYVSR